MSSPSTRTAVPILLYKRRAGCGTVLIGQPARHLLCSSIMMPDDPEIITWFEVPGKPVGKERAAGTSKRHTPEKTRVWEREIAWRAKQARRSNIIYPKAVGVIIQIVIKPAEYWKKEEKDNACAGRVKPVARPDIDNVGKAILDGLNKIAFADDQQVSQLTITRAYGRSEKTIVIVKKINDADWA